jgi:hypothetical protein
VQLAAHATVCDALRRSIVPLTVAVPGLPWLADAAIRASNSALGRDQGIFQYVAWAASQGEKLYRDVRDVNGPLVAFLHLGLQKLGGESARGFRTLDLLFTSLTFAFVGACLPSLASREVTIRERMPWALASSVMLLAQYLTFGFWDTAQRESFFDWFLAVAIGAILLARRRAGLLVLAGACSAAPVFGKPTFLLFTLAHLLTVALDRDSAIPRRRRLIAFVGGMAITAVVMFGFLALYGDLASWARITFSDVPTMYRFIWPRTPRAIVTMPGYSFTTGVALVATVLGIVLVAAKRLPVRALAIVTVPALGLASVLIQQKGFPYHFHPVTFGIGLVGLAFVFVVDEHPRAPAWLAFAFAAFFGVRAAMSARMAGIYATWEHDAHYVRVDYFPESLALGAAHVAATTKPDERVQTYAMDAYLLYLAKRKSATPFIYAYDLNVDVALHGSFDEGGPRPTPADTARIQALRDGHERDLVDRMGARPPAAFVFVDKSPLMSSEDALADFEQHCPTAVTFLLANYRETANFDGIRVWSRIESR